MSQRTTPKSPRSKSPSCQEDDIVESGNVSRARFDDMPDERLGDSGVRNYSRAGSVQDPRSRNASPLRPNSRLGSGYNNEEDLYQLPSSPRTLSAHGSRGASPGVSQRISTRLPTPEYSRSKSRAGSPFLGSREDGGLGVSGIECDEGESPEDLEGPLYLSRATSYSPRDRSTRGPSEVMGGSNLNSVHFVPSRPSAESRGTQGQPTCPASSEMSGLASTKGSGWSSFAGLPSATGSTSGAGYSSSAGISGAGLPSATGSTLGAGYSSAGTSGAGLLSATGSISGAGYSSSIGTSGAGLPSARGSASNAGYSSSIGTSGAGLPSARGSASNAGYSSTGIWGAGLPSATGSTSGAGYSSSAGTMLGLSCPRQSPDVISGSFAPGVSAISRKQLSCKEGSRLEQTCRADCRRHLSELEKVGSSKAPLRSLVSGLSENPKQRNSQPLYSQEVRQAGPEPYVHSGGRGNTSTRTHAGHEPFMKGLQVPAASHVHHHHHHDGRLQDELERDGRAMAALAHLSQLKKTPSYLMCGVNQNVDFFNVCSEEKRTKKLPERPCLQQEELAELIKCERQDVESAWYLASEERKSHKKPCPKQQKAQMNVRAIVKAHANQTCGEKYPPLEHPDPEDISPEVAASMMFSQEQGIKMDDCPKNTILHLFPDEFKQPFPEKILRNSISIVDPNERGQEELIEKSAAVPSEGVSDSAYTRTMKEKGEELLAQKSFDVDFAIGQSKREYVLVAQKPRRFSKVQFRGGKLPSWFPGYFSAFPNESGIKSVSSPSGVFHKAWFHANPRNMPTNDVIVLD